MAINPNTTFVANAVLPASQMNRLPFGIVAQGTRTATESSLIVVTAEVTVTSSAFTAIANRYYKITFYEPELSSPSTGYMQMRILKGTTVFGTQIQAGTAINGNGTTTYGQGQCVAYTTLTAGSQQVCGSLECSAGTGKAGAGATNFAFILVEDIGPA